MEKLSNQKSCFSVSGIVHNAGVRDFEARIEGTYPELTYMLFNAMIKSSDIADMICTANDAYQKWLGEQIDDERQDREAGRKVKESPFNALIPTIQKGIDSISDPELKKALQDGFDSLVKE